MVGVWLPVRGLIFSMGGSVGSVDLSEAYVAPARAFGFKVRGSSAY